MASVIQRIFREHFDGYRRGQSLPARILKAAQAIRACRTAALGGHVQTCPAGHVERVWYNSCRHRACPLCAFVRVSEWIQQQLARLPACDYYHVVFTLPSELNRFWEADRQAVTNLFFRTAWEALEELLGDAKYLGALPGAIATFQSWGQNLWVHPHVHLLVTGGGLDADGQWVKAKAAFLLPSRVLSAKFRGKFLALFRRAVERAELALPAGCSEAQARSLCNKLGRRKWHVQIMPPYAHGRGVLTYLGRYVRGGPISDRRIAGYDGQTVQIRCKDYAGAPAGEAPVRRTVRLTAAEFLERLGGHVPVPGTHMVRAYGLFAPNQRERLNRARALLGQLPVAPAEALDWQTACAAAGPQHPECCPVCGQRLIVRPLPEFRPSAPRAEPTDRSRWRLAG